jgi:formyltetrahydrofolate-dependent phosphoribosylglycinamide formyltransferase
MKRIIVLISENGSNLGALIHAIDEGTLPCTIALVVSNRSAADGLKRAEQAGIPTRVFPIQPYSSAEHPRTAYDADLAALLNSCQPDLIVLAGWMHIFSPAFLNTIEARVINLHPALPGLFPGVDAIGRQYRAFRAGEIAFGGCMVHEVTAELDAGRVLGEAIVPLYEHDTLESFEERIHAAEHALLVVCVRQVLG